MRAPVTTALWVAGLLLPAPCSGAADAAVPVTLYVASNGNDHWSGRRASVNADRTDGPLATLTGARDAVRRLRTDAGGKLGPVTVHVRGGTYRLAGPFVLEPQDSGSSNGPVVYTAFKKLNVATQLGLTHDEPAVQSPET